MKWNGGVFIDMCLPFGLRSPPKLFDLLADLLAWIAGQHSLSYLIHYLDDFMTIGPLSSPICQNNLDTLVHICNYLGVPLALEKVEGPEPALPFLVIILDSINMEARLPQEKLVKEVAEWVGCTDAK